MAQTKLGPTFNGTYQTIQSGDYAWSYQGGLYPTSRTVDGASDPKWREKIAKRVDATLPYSISGYKKEGQMRSVDWHWKWKGQYDNKIHDVNLVGYPLYNSLFSAVGSSLDTAELALESEVKLAFLGKIRDAESPFMAGVFAGELKETIGMVRSLRHPLRGILRETRKYRQALIYQSRRIFSRRVDRIADIMGDLYLQWTYGVNPLLGDIKSVGEAWKNLFANAAETQRISVTIPKDIDITKIATGLTYWESGGAHVWSTSSIRRKIKVQIRGAIRRSVEGPTWHGLQENFSANLRDFVPTVYELIPYSFLVDYVSSLGDVVNGLYTSTDNLIYASKSVLRSHVGEILVVPVPSIIGIPLSQPWSVAAGVVEKFSFNRSKADLTVRLSDIRLTLPDTKQMFNAFVLGLSKSRSVADRVLFPS